MTALYSWVVEETKQPSMFEKKRDYREVFSMIYDAVYSHLFVMSE